MAVSSISFFLWDTECNCEYTACQILLHGTNLTSISVTLQPCDKGFALQNSQVLLQSCRVTCWNGDCDAISWAADDNHFFFFFLGGGGGGGGGVK